MNKEERNRIRKKFKEAGTKRNNLYTVLPTVVVEKINFMADLPEDLGKVISVTKLPNTPIVNIDVKYISYCSHDPFNDEAYSLKSNKIYFSGGFSRWWLVKLYQKWKERQNPTKYKIEYYSAKMCEQLL